ncbi:ATP synthase subunit delta, mitochondrial [Grifola frondosa]|uniref:ATP synthase subunit delta, mitochondrial n=1 Tax=Grifola frondosa TaxID=5627 RepID=A0A1C7M6Z9_GRIFR|nr:ATP synthase subunit delta, mitochondrial [Grifola frondosa]
MSALRFVSSAARRAPKAFASGRRGYAEVADKIKLSLVLPHQAIFTSADVVQVNLPAATGDMGVLANHAATIEPLRPGVVEVIESGSASKKWFVSGGFATVHPNNKLTINAVEAAPLEDFSAEAVRANLQEALRVVAGNGSEEDKTTYLLERSRTLRTRRGSPNWNQEIVRELREVPNGLEAAEKWRELVFAAAQEQDSRAVQRTRISISQDNAALELFAECYWLLYVNRKSDHEALIVVNNARKKCGFRYLLSRKRRKGWQPLAL